MSRLKLFLYSHSRQKARKRLLIVLMVIIGGFAVLLPFKQKVKEASIFSIPERITPNELKKREFYVYQESDDFLMPPNYAEKRYVCELYIGTYATKIYYLENDTSKIAAQTIVMDNLTFKILTKLPVKKYETISIEGSDFRVDPSPREKIVYLKRLDLANFDEDKSYPYPNIHHIDLKERLF